MPLNPKYEQFLQRDVDKLYEIGVDQMRQVFLKMMEEGEGAKLEVGSIEELVVKTSVRDTTIRIYSPKVKETDGVVIWMHGGGFVFGNIECGDSHCRQLTNRINCVVISIDYGLCPPYRFPDPVNECYEVVKWISENAEELGINRNKICLTGDSVGGTLSVAICLMARDKNGFSIALQVPIYPCLDWNDIGERKARRENGKGYWLTRYGIQWFIHYYMRDRIVDSLNPYCSPLLAKHFDRLPPALVITGEYDIMRDEDLDYVQALTDAGVEATSVCYPGTIHGFLSFQQLGLEEPAQCYALISKKVSEVFSKIK